MRVLVLSALLACVSAAPSFLAPVPIAYNVAPLALAPVVVAPTVPPGDIQAAAIDAQVKIADQAQLLADQARELTEQAAENPTEGVVESNDLAQEKSGLDYWAAEEKKWQALNEAQIAEAAKAAADAVAPSDEAADSGSEAEAKSEDIEVKTEEKAEVKAAEAETPVEAEKPAEAEKTDDAVEVKAAAPEAPKAEVVALPAAVGIASALNFQPYVAPLTYQAAYGAYPYHAIHPVAAFPHVYQPAVALKQLW